MRYVLRVLVASILFGACLTPSLEADIQQLITNGNFASNSSGWTLEDDFYADNRFPNAHTAPGYAYLSESDGSPGNDLGGKLYQELTIPANTLPTTVFTFWYYITTVETSGSPDELKVTVRTPSGSFLEELVELDNRDTPIPGLTYVFWNGDLNDYIGQTIRIQFEGDTNSTEPTTFRIDSVSLLANVEECSRPDSDTNNPQNISQTSATLHGDVDPNGCPTDGWFMVGGSPSTLNTEVGRQPAGSGNSEVDFEYTYTNLPCGQTLYYEMFSENAGGVDHDNDVESFSTLPCVQPPSATTLAASEITATTATLKGNVNPNGLLTVYSYLYIAVDSGEPSISAPIPAGIAGSGTNPVSVPVPITDLACGTQYSFYLVAVSDGGQDNNIDNPLTFTTAPCAGHPGEFTMALDEPFCDRYDPEGPAIRINWTTSSGANTYTLYRDGAIYPNGVGIVGNTFLNSLGLVEGNTYQYMVVAHNDSGYTPSNTETITVPNNVCDEPDFPPLRQDVDDGRSYGGSGSGSSGGSNPVCGNGTLETGEDCDLGGENGECPGSCSGSCTTNTCSNTPPTISLIEPDGSGDTTDTSFTIRWIDDDPDDDALIRLKWSPEADCTPNNLIKKNISEDDEADSLLWDTSGLPPGDYYVRAMIDDGVSPIAISCSGPVTKTTGSGNSPPSITLLEPNGVGDSADASFTIQWVDSDPDDDAAIRLKWSPEADCTPSAFIQKDISEDDETDQWVWDTSALGEGNYYVRATIDDGVNPLGVDCSGPVAVTANPVNVAPSITLLEPDGSGDTADTSFTIRWNDSDPDSNAEIRLKWSPEADCTPSNLIERGLLEDEETDQWVWDTSELPEGDYYVRATINDGVNPLGVACAGPISVVHGSGPIVLFEDDFNDNSIDSQRWTRFDGHTVSELDGVLQTRADVTDQYGVAETAWFDVNPDVILTIKRRVRHHYGNNYYIGTFSFVLENEPDYTWGVKYGQMQYQSSIHCPVFGIYMVRNNNTPHQCDQAGGPNISPMIAPIWDTWFDERFEYSPGTGAIDYYINDILQLQWNVGPVAAGGATPPRAKIQIVPWGWWTGHEQLVDDLIVTASEGDSAPRPLFPPVATDLCMYTRPALGADGMLYAAAGSVCDKSIAAVQGPAAFDPSDGSVAWGPVVPDGCDNSSSGIERIASQGVSLGSNGLLFGVGDWNQCRNGRLVAFNTLDGSVFRDHGDCPGSGNTSPHPRQVPAIDEARASVFFGSSRLCSVDTGTVTNNWVASGGSYTGSRGIAIDQMGNIYYGTHTGNGNTGQVLSFSPIGSQRWLRSFSTSSSPEVMAHIGGRLLLYYSNDNTLLAWDAATGADVAEEAWPLENLSRPVSDEAGTIYASGVTTPEVVALNQDGSERWRVDLTSYGAAEANVDFVDSDGRLYVRSGSTLVALDTENGAVVWSYETTAPILVPVALDGNGNIVITDSSQILTVLDTAASYASSEWAVAEFANGRHTSKARLVAPPIVLIHGLGSSGGTWSVLAETLEEAGLSFGGFPHYSNADASVVNVAPGDFYQMHLSDWSQDPFPSQNLTVSRQGFEVAEVVAAVLEANPAAERVILIGHSMGGLAARAYVQGFATGAPYRDDVAQLVTIGTPHHGSFLADVCILSANICLALNLSPDSVAVSELAPGSDALLQLNDILEYPLPSTIEYSAVVGLGMGTLGDTGILEPGDGIVTQDSQDPGILVNPWRIIPITMDPCGELTLHQCQTHDPQIHHVLIEELSTH